jgi:hypothetical protein
MSMFHHNAVVRAVPTICSNVPLLTLGTGMSVQSSLLYNEYIVYKEAQACMRYLLKVKFIHTVGRSY